MTRTAIVTGGSRGIGRRVAETLAADGFHVILTFRRNGELANEVVAGIRDAGGSAVAVRLELESEADIDALFAEHLPEGQRLDLLIASAAASAFHPVAELKVHHLERSWATNVRSFVQLSQRAVPRMTDGGRIVAITSYGSVRAFPGYGAIGADKAAIESWVRHMAAEFGRSGVTVNAVNAGLVDTDSLRHYYERPGVPPIESIVAKIPLGRVGTVDDVAGAVKFLTGPHGGYVTGHVLTVDGGLTVVAPPFWSEFP
ncbi:MAG: enoyl-[acyl-carrier protein] reductase [Actinomycetota bacterium]|nr:family oxidoreductase [Glaciihabitans sp.]MDQ1543672.1 enoyl-[acyl-carrier protein] reductase [Actinomycetota bacterium]MDQ1562405.1 enoyl-[acyl-carrier protein] reductase [Actinomycetota bacterium]MDQ1572526.1 enoyl-[acyl-carrier protein] reductase [Actinomycetota bacterium]